MEAKQKMGRDSHHDGLTVVDSTARGSPNGMPVVVHTAMVAVPPSSRSVFFRDVSIFRRFGHDF